MITEERLKFFQKEASLQEISTIQFLMMKAGKLTSITSVGLTTIQVKVNTGSFLTPVFPLVYSAGDTLTFTYAYTDLFSVTGNLILIGKDN